MINITTSYYGDDRLCSFSEPITASVVVSTMFSDVVESVIAVYIDGEVCDLASTITASAVVNPVLIDCEEGINILRKSTAFITAMAVSSVVPNMKLAVCAETSDGFYLDFDSETKLSEKSFEDIEKKIEEIVRKDEKFVRETWSKKEAITFFENNSETYQLEILEQNTQENVIVYRCGSHIFQNHSPLVPSTKYIGALKLTKLSGVYWLGDSKNKMLQRISGVVQENKEKLDAYFKLLEEAERRDHRKIAKDLEWFHIQNEALGQVFWHDKGWTLYRTIEEYLRKKLRENGYTEIKTPIMLDRKLWEKSGHWEKFRENMFIVSDQNSQELAIKPMNCPCHVQIFKSKTRSYKDLPIRMAEFGMCHRNEPSGSLYGLMRVRGFTQDDAHIFCTHDQIRDEVRKFYKLLVEVYNDFGFKNIDVKLSDRPEERIGSDEMWDMAERSLMDSMDDEGVKYTINKGDGAFYGPKLEFTLKDALGRNWQCGTIQLDFVLPSRLGAYYVGSDGNKHHPVMIHRAILGTLERFIGILIESYAGNLPAWLAPVQLEILTVNSSALEYATTLANKAREHNIRVELNSGEESIGQKIRKSIFNKIPVLWVVGSAETADCTVSVRHYGTSNACSMEADKALKTLVTYVSIRQVL
ncbi:threonine--tRNA ligase [Anaplasma phagocytophilum]|uniref:threonine--tRNA ligase n=1 Tax=Anaplasma phagocytophilum TaxID=948 RepID=UPI0007E08BF0|nr:threonine--tRNA ligase [Anaplasma phagocytophilum]SBO32735.1 Threonine--tRNA ligase [Anaplasma phagocytophilum]SBO32796.1 Threonine--tRNA ligase [Anaplasma phagocytophilum]SBO33156.1 Threonine--tRNA ligase [Anaplasma phagocytophilum]SCV65085.1 Threonine--tRNA ligase [Anaplasma phagocytophilum]